MLARMKDGIYSLSRYSSRCAGCFRIGIVSFLWLAKMGGQVPRWLYPFYRVTSPSSLMTLGCLKDCSLKCRAQTRRQLTTYHLLYATYHVPKRVLYPRVKSVEIQSQWVAPNNLLIVSSIQKDFEEGLKLVYFEVLLIRGEQAVCKQEGLDEYLSTCKSNNV